MLQCTKPPRLCNKRFLSQQIHFPHPLHNHRHPIWHHCVIGWSVAAFIKSDNLNTPFLSFTTTRSFPNLPPPLLDPPFLEWLADRPILFLDEQAQSSSGAWNIYLHSFIKILLPQLSETTILYLGHEEDSIVSAKRMITIPRTTHVACKDLLLSSGGGDWLFGVSGASNASIQSGGVGAFDSCFFTTYARIVFESYCIKFQ